MFLFNRQIGIISFLLLLLGYEAAAANTTLSPIIIPAPPGPYATEFEIQVMVDSSRPDPFNSTEKARKILTSVFTPIPTSECSNFCNVQYMPRATAAGEDAAIGSSEPLFGRLQLSGICCNASSSHDYDALNPPLIIWSPGFGESRLIWSTMSQYLASYGYQVVLVDHPGDGSIVEFPDGTIVRGVDNSNSTGAQRNFALNVETADVLFVIESYSKGTCGANRKYGDNKVGVVAHGAISSQAALNDSLNGHPGRISAGVNLDGRYNGPVLTLGNGAGEKSFLLWVPPSGPENATSWDLWWNTTDELDPGTWRKEIEIANSTQGTISDLPLLADISGFREADAKVVNSTLGTIPGARSVSIFTTYHAAFFDMFVKGERESLLVGPSAAFPEVSFVRSST
jgi:hypothetical protein